MKPEFEQALLFGQQAEGRLRDLLQFAGAFVSKFGNSNKNDFQVVFNNQTHRVEIKNEDRYAGGRNICVEVLQGRPPKQSGVAISEASIFIHTLGDRVVIYRRARMHEWVRKQYASKWIQLKTVGDNFNQCFILPIDDLIEHVDWFDVRPMTTVADSHLWMS
jgi:hypothetical protein